MRIAPGRASQASGPWWRWRVVPAGMEWVALTQSPHRKQAPAQRSVADDARRGVARARRLEAADGPEQAQDQLREGELVEPDECEENRGHRGCCAASKGGA